MKCLICLSYPCTRVFGHKPDYGDAGLFAVKDTAATFDTGTPKVLDTKVKHEDQGAHYRYSLTVRLQDSDIKSGTITVKLDPFRVAAIYKMNSFALKTVLKKILCAGNRGHKDYKQDIKDCITALERELQMIEEDKRYQY